MKEELINVLEEHFQYKKELDAIWAVFLKERDCCDAYSVTVKDYELGIDTRAAAIIYIIEEYFRNKK